LDFGYNTAGKELRAARQPAAGASRKNPWQEAIPYFTQKSLHKSNENRGYFIISSGRMGE
jgi:hypothetical protein